MKRLAIDFADRRAGSRRRWIAAGLGSAALVLATAGLVLDFAPAVATPGESGSPAPAEEVQAVDRAARRLNHPWPDILEAVEAAAGKDSALLAVEADPEQGLVRLTGEARSAGAVLDLLPRLRRHPAVAQVALIEQETRQDDPARPSRFLLELRLHATP